jgi:cytochrome b6-f complex iron-sulfur subunit
MAENNNRPYTEAPEEKGITRRHFLRRIWWGALGLLGLQSAAGLVVSLKPQITEGSFGSKVNIATLEEVRAMPVGTVAYYREQRFYLSRVEGGVLALYRKCTHLGCVVPWVPDDPAEDDVAKTGRFHCPCHGGVYDRFGVVRAGPPPRPLDIFPIDIDGENVIVDTGRIITRSGFEESQLTRVQ